MNFQHIKHSVFPYKILFSLFLTVSLVACVSTSSNQTKADIQDTTSSNTSVDDSIDGTYSSENELDSSSSQLLPVKSTNDYFYYANPEILKNVIIGTPESLKKTEELLTNAEQDSTNSDKVLLLICSGIMQQVWLNNSIQVDVPDDFPENIYIDTLNSAISGVYEPTEISDDFFELMLSSLTVFTTTPVDQYFDNSEKALTKALELQPDSIVTTYMLGVLYLKSEKYAQAVPLLQKTNFAVPLSTSVKKNLVLALEADNKIKEAYKLAKELLTFNPEEKEYLKIVATLAFKIKDYKNADIYISKVLQQESGNIDYLMLYAKILFEEQNYVQVSTILDVLARNNTITYDYLLLRARLQMVWNKNNAAAIATLEEALKQFPDDLDTLVLASELACSTSQAINGKTALELSDSVLKKDFSNVRALLVKVRENIKIKDWEQAYSASTLLISFQPSNVEAYLLHIEICLELSYVKEARKIVDYVNLNFFTTGDSFELLQGTTQEDYENFQKWSLRLLLAESNTAEAENYIANHLADASSNLKSILYYERSCINESDEMKLLDLRSSLTSNPRNSDALFALYEYYFKKKDYRKASYYLRQVISLNSTDSYFLQLNSKLDALLAE